MTIFSHLCNLHTTLNIRFLIKQFNMQWWLTGNQGSANTENISNCRHWTGSSQLIFMQKHDFWQPHQSPVLGGISCLWQLGSSNQPSFEDICLMYVFLHIPQIKTLTMRFATPPILVLRDISTSLWSGDDYGLNWNYRNPANCFTCKNWWIIQ